MRNRNNPTQIFETIFDRGTSGGFKPGQHRIVEARGGWAHEELVLTVEAEQRWAERFWSRDREAVKRSVVMWTN